MPLAWESYLALQNDKGWAQWPQAMELDPEECCNQELVQEPGVQEPSVCFLCGQPGRWFTHGLLLCSVQGLSKVLIEIPRAYVLLVIVVVVQVLSLIDYGPH